jgi:hypothetical protein
MILHIKDRDRDNVRKFEIQVPFEREEADELEMQDLKREILELYSQYSAGYVTGLYDYELEEEQNNNGPQDIDADDSYKEWLADDDQ